jgi:hypothetical protein
MLAPSNMKLAAVLVTTVAFGVGSSRILIPVQGDGAVIVGSTFPASMTPGQRATISITVRNSGTTPWDTNVKLGAVGDLAGDATRFLAGAGGDATRVWLAPGETITAGAQKTFTFDIVAPAAGTYVPSFRMVRESVHWFGTTTSRVVHVCPVTAGPTPAPPPAPAPSVTDAATILSVSIPATMFAGQRGGWKIEVRNDGSTTWNEDFRLGVVDDMAGDGSRFMENAGYPDVGRIHLPLGTTVAPGASFTFDFAVVAPTANGTYDVKLRMVHENVDWFGGVAEQTVVVNGPPPITLPTTDQLRSFRGDFCGIRVPELLQYGTKDVFFTAMYPAYPPALRTKLRQIYRAHGYTHMPIATAASYHGVYPEYDLTGDPKAFRAILEEMYRDGIIPVVFMIDDGHWPAGFFNGPDTAGIMAAVQAKYDPIWAECKDLVKIVVPGWEVDPWMTPDVVKAICHYLKQRLPDALVYIHFTTNQNGDPGYSVSPGQTLPDWWRSMQGVLQGFLYQTNANVRSADVAARMDDYTLRFQTGYHGWPTGFDVVAFEYAAYWEVWQGQPESWGDSFGNDLMKMVSPPIQGFCNGGDPSLQPPLPGQSVPPPMYSPPTIGTPAPAPAPPPPAPPPAPSGLTAPTIVSNTLSGTTITWNDAGRGGRGYFVDIDDDGDWNDGFWNLNVAGQTTATAPAGFTPYGGAVGPLVLTPGKTYTVRIYYVATQEHSPDATFTAAAVPAPPPSPPPGAVPADDIDLGQAVIENSPGDVASWPATTKITKLQIDQGGNTGFHIDFTKRDGTGSWPDYTPPGWNGAIEYTLWIVIKVSGQWYASGCIQIWRDPSGTLWSGGPPSGVAANWYYDRNRWGAMTGHQPAVGEQVGFFVTAGNARNERGVTSVRERSNVVMVSFPSDQGAVFDYGP